MQAKPCIIGFLIYELLILVALWGFLTGQGCVSVPSDTHTHTQSCLTSPVLCYRPSSDQSEVILTYLWTNNNQTWMNPISGCLFVYFSLYPVKCFICPWEGKHDGWRVKKVHVNSFLLQLQVTLATSNTAIPKEWQNSCRLSCIMGNGGITFYKVEE